MSIFEAWLSIRTPLQSSRGYPPSDRYTKFLEKHHMGDDAIAAMEAEIVSKPRIIENPTSDDWITPGSRIRVGGEIHYISTAEAQSNMHSRVKSKES